MPKKIAMTPCGSTEWNMEGTPRGRVVLPDGAPSEVTSLLFGLADESPDLELIGRGTRGPSCASVYRYGDYAIRVTEGIDGEHSGLGWLQANLTLGIALAEATPPEDMTVKTPAYQGALIGDNGMLAVMSYEGEGRRHPKIKEELDRAKIIHNHCRAALEAPQLGNSRYAIFLDCSPDNLLLGSGDAVKLDAQLTSGQTLV